MEVRVSDVKKWAGREETVQLVQPWPAQAQDRVDFPLVHPARVDVLVRSAGGGTLLVRISGQVNANVVCTRCAESFEISLPFDVTEEFREQAGRNDESLDYSRFTGDVIVLDDMISDAVGVSFPIALLCRPDCQGLCPTCGANWNVGTCQCSVPLDERWAALQLLSKSEPDQQELEREKHGRSKA